MVSRIERNIVKEILRECYPKNLHPNEDFVMYFLKLVLLDPNWGITENLLGSRANVQKLVKYMISELESKDSVKLMTLKMQFYFMWSLDHINDVVVNNTKILLSRLAPIKEQAMISVAEYPAEIEKLRKVIVIYAIFVSGLGNPMREAVYSEGLAALKSIISEEELKEFAISSRERKDEQLTEITKLIAGIRIFNKYCLKGGADIPDLAELYKNAAKVVKEEMNLVLGKVLTKAVVLTTLFGKCYTLKESNGVSYFDYIAAPKGGREYLEIAKDQLIHYRQYELFVRKVLQILDEIDAKVEKVDEEIENLLEKMATIVQARLAVPVNVIFPLFEQLSDYWTILQHQVILLAKYGSIIANLETYCKTMKIDPGIIDDLVELSVLNDDEEKVENIDEDIESENPHVEVFQANQLSNAESINLQYLGFCCWRLVETKGLLVPGKPHLGIIKFKDDFFVFSSNEAGVCFSRKPDEYIKEVLSLARSKPQLINFLLLHAELMQVSNIKKLVADKIHEKKTADKGIQSEDSYVIQPYKEKSITWNIWDLKRNLLLMANLSKCQTTSVQTVKSHSTNSIRMQTIILKERETQTLVDKHTSVPTPSNFIYGLRGRKDDKQFVFDLTRPVHE